MSAKHLAYGEEVLKTLKDSGLRAELDRDDETLGKKIRSAKMQKIPYLLIVGDKEVENKTVTAEARGAEKGETLSVPDFCAKIEEELKSRK
ncbi:MAG: Threonine--tRNA ligase 1 [bacterium ADurb.Bin425]|nr:MAG: Threonine--tRNA ligase 1 [bacterium ADurb.Bin425]